MLGATPAFLGVPAAGAAPAPLALLPAGTRVAFLGDTIAQQGDTGAASGIPLSSIGVGPYSWARVLFPAARMDVWKSSDARPTGAPRYFSGSNHGLNGDTTGPSGGNPGLGSRLPEVLAMNAPVVVIDGGVYDILAGIDAAATVANKTAMAQAVVDAGRRALLTTVRPFLATHGGVDNTARAAQRKAVNAQLRAWAAGRAGVTLLDVAAVYEDPAQNGDYALASLLNDTLLPGPAGAFLEGQMIRDALAAHIAPGDWQAAAFTGANLVLNPAMTNTTGGATGSVSNGRTTGTPPRDVSVASPGSTAGSSCAVSVVDRNGGKALRLLFTLGGTATEEVWAVNLSNITDGVPAIGTAPCRAMVDVEAGGSGALGSIALAVRKLSGSATQAVAMSNNPAHRPLLPPFAYAGRLVTHAFEMAGDQTGVKLFVNIPLRPSASAAGSTVEVFLQNFRFGPVADPRAA